MTGCQDLGEGNLLEQLSHARSLLMSLQTLAGVLPWTCVQRLQMSTLLQPRWLMASGTGMGVECIAREWNSVERAASGARQGICQLGVQASRCLVVTFEPGHRGGNFAP